MEAGEFHLEQGLHFKRTESGGVRIRKLDNDGETEFEVTTDDSGWASVVASVCVDGEDHRTWDEALKFHNGHS